MRKIVAVVVFILSVPSVFAQNVKTLLAVEFQDAVSADEASNRNN